MVPDGASRLKQSCGSKDCQVERFLRDLPQKIQCMSVNSSNFIDVIIAHMDPVLIAATTGELSEILKTSAGPIPLGSRQSWIEIQAESPDCQRFITCKRLGQIPGRKDKDKAVLNRMMKQCSLENGLIVSRTFDNILMEEINKVFVPSLFLNPILAVMHVRLSHPLPAQLQAVFEKYFVAFNVKRECEILFQECSYCDTLRRFPKQLEQFQPLLVPEHPGSHMNIDTIKRASQNILVNCNLFSGYTTATIIKSENTEDTVQGILNIITPIRHCASVIIRVDRAPALRSLAKNKCEDLTSTSILSQAVTNINNRIRNQGLTSAQIHFSRDTTLGKNLPLDDNKLMENKLEKKRRNHPSSIKSKVPGGEPHKKLI